jgi:hypothetical protein
LVSIVIGKTKNRPGMIQHFFTSSKPRLTTYTTISPLFWPSLSSFLNPFNCSEVLFVFPSINHSNSFICFIIQHLIGMLN